MYNKAVDNYVHTLELVPDCYKTQEMCNKAVNTYPSAKQLIPECYKTQEMYHKAVDACHFVSDSVLDLYKNQEMCDKVFPRDLNSKSTFLIDIRLKKCVIKMLMLVWQH